MKVARVAGTVVSPICHPFFEGQRLLLCDLLDVDGEPLGTLPATIEILPAALTLIGAGEG